MSAHLDGCWMKLDRAKDHLQTLNDEAAPRLGAEGPDEADPILMRFDFEPERSSYVLRIHKLPEHPWLRWGAIVGDVISNLRAALDHLAWQLVSIGERPPSALSESEREGVAFPISDGPRDRLIRSMKKRLPGVPWPALAYIERQQPYDAYHMKQLSPLRRLRELSNRDKHRVITPLGFAIEDPGTMSFVPNDDCRLGQVFLKMWTPFEPGAEIAVAPAEIVGPEPDVKMHGSPTLYIAFEDGAHASLYLGSMMGSVTRILEAFQPFFDSLAGSGSL